MKGTLFTSDYLERGIKDTDAWRRLDAEGFASFGDHIRAAAGGAPIGGTLNEADTETEVILPILNALGWHSLRQHSIGRELRPDFVLFTRPEDKAAAVASESDPVGPYAHGRSFLEAKKWGRTLDRGDDTNPADYSVPSNQMIEYLRRVDAVSAGRILWGVLTNGRIWRLYWQGARSRSEQFFEIDLGVLFKRPDARATGFVDESADPDHWLRVFYLLFRAESFIPDPADPGKRTFHHMALDEGRLWEAKVAEDLSRVVFDRVYPQVIRGLAAGDPLAPDVLTAAYLAEVRRAALTFLYRLLFVFYAEDRDLLPARERRYEPYSLRSIRAAVAKRIDDGEAFSPTALRFHPQLSDLFRAIDQGDKTIGLPAYNGGLFDADEHPLLNRSRLPDAVLAPLLDGLSRRDADEAGGGGRRLWINYRDLSVQHLGGVYERLLDFDAVPDGSGGIAVRPGGFARRVSGSYYTHDSLVMEIVKRTVDPLLQDRINAFVTAVDRGDAVAPELDPATAMLELRACDPAMGSGHFLVTLVDYLADRVIAAVALTESRAPGVRSPLTDRIVAVRERILANARADGWTVTAEQLDDRHIVRRLILKRVVHGVDKNPMAVELAKVALWLHTFTIGAPLSFLDHHLCCGDALFGERIEAGLRELREAGGLFVSHELSVFRKTADNLSQIADLPDSDTAEVERSKELYKWAMEKAEPLRAFLDFRQALRWLGIALPKRTGNGARKAVGKSAAGGGEPALAALFEARLSNPFAVIAAGKVARNAALTDAERTRLNEILAAARAVAERERFFHWELVFPGVFPLNGNGRAVAGFDLVLGNPPWDRMKLQEVEWFADRKPEIASAPRAADRSAMIRTLREAGDPLWTEFVEAEQRAETATRLAREGGEYPLLSGGDVNLYSLFVERAQALVRPDGIVGLLTPSGIAADKGAAPFFRSISTTGRLGALLDFENRRTFFPDVDSRFKFSILVFRGAGRQFDRTDCAFFLRNTDELDDPDRIIHLTAADFAAVNPNTGTAPVFRSRRDADITTRIYRDFPVLVDRRTDPPQMVWPFRYATMFHMTNDSHLFRTTAELEALGFYQVSANEWRKGPKGKGTSYVPLYEGKMVRQYNHRYASVITNPANRHNPGRPNVATDKELRNPRWIPVPQYWVPRTELTLPSDYGWVVCFRDIARATDERTVIASAAPGMGFSNKLPLLLPDESVRSADYAVWAPLLLANLNSRPFDYVTRQKLQSTSLNLYILEQLPVIPPEAYEEMIGDQQIGDFVRGEVLALSYTAHDLEPFARDLGYEGPPFAWDEEDRRHRIARLDALFFHLYGIAPDDAAYILDSFPIVKRQDEETFGTYRTKALVLAYMRAVAAGDLGSRVHG